MFGLGGRDAALDGLNVTAIRRRLFAEKIGTHLYIFGHVFSTNAALRALADAGAHEGTVMLAEEQRAHELSPPHLNLYASVLFRPSIGTAGALVFSFMSALALTEAMWALGAAVTVEGPNTMVIGTHRVAASHLDVVTLGDRVAHLMIGVAVNVNAERGALAAGATSLREHLGRLIDRNALAADYLNQLEKWVSRCRAQGPEAIVTAWSERDVPTVLSRRERVS